MSGLLVIYICIQLLFYVRIDVFFRRESQIERKQSEFPAKRIILSFTSGEIQFLVFVSHKRAEVP